MSEQNKTQQQKIDWNDAQMQDSRTIDWLLASLS